jgi:hypothetical protein
MTNVPYTFGNESSPIPLSQLDANFAVIPNYANTAGNVVNADQANITGVGTLTSLSVSGNINSGNLRTGGAISALGNIDVGNVNTGGNLSAYGTITGGAITTAGTLTGGNITTAGLVSAVGNIRGGNITTPGRISAQGNIISQRIISATGNIVTDELFVGNFLGNITGNLSVGGSNTQVLFNRNGNVGAAGGLTYNSGSNVLTILGSVNAQTAINTDGNLTVAGTAQFTGLVTAPTPVSGTANNQVATAAFVGTAVGELGTMARQDAISVAITGGTIGNAIVTLASIANSSFASGSIASSAISTSTISSSNITGSNITGSNITNTTSDRVTMAGGWSVIPVGATLYFQYGGTNLGKLDSAGNFTVKGDVIAFGSV